MKKKKLNEFNQQDIQKAIESFDTSYFHLQIIYDDILAFSSPKKSLGFKKVLQSKINDYVLEIEESIAYAVLIEIFGISYENSTKIPSFFDIFQGIPHTSSAILPWQYTIGNIYKKNIEDDFKNIKSSKTLKVSNINDFEKFIQLRPNESKIILDRMHDPSRSQRSKELLDLYTYICFAEDANFNLDVTFLNLKGINIKQEIKSKNLKDLKNEVFKMCNEYYKIYEKDISNQDFLEPNDKELNWSFLIQKSDEFKNKLIEFREKDVLLFSNFSKNKKDLLCMEVREVLETNNQNISFMPSSTILNKMLGGSGVVKKIGKEFGYNEFFKIYNDWIGQELETELKVKSSLNKGINQTQSINPLDND